MERRTNTLYRYTIDGIDVNPYEDQVDLIIQGPHTPGELSNESFEAYLMPATTEKAGVMSSSDKTKLDTILMDVQSERLILNL